MPQTAHPPTDAKAGPTKPAVRAVLARAFVLSPDDNFVEAAPVPVA
jgi:cobalt-precorrin-6B (C15)-methyltransferase